MRTKCWTKAVRRGLGALICIATLFGGFVVNAEKEQVKVSEKEYLVNINNSSRLYMCNEKAVTGEIGSKVFLTYTVDRVSENAIFRSGLCASEDKANPAPFSGKGKMIYSKRAQLFEPEWTYVYRMERTEKGFEYHAARMKGDETQTITFSSETSASSTDPFTYYGLLFECMEGELTAILTHVRCYDEKGRDLGIYFNDPSGVTSMLLDVHFPINSKYNFTIDNASSVAISNKYPTDSDTVYMEYEVENVKNDKSYQHGLLCSWRPKEEFPHAMNNGVILWKQVERDAKDKILLREGGKYFICMTKKDNKFEAIVQFTKNGETETTAFQGKTVSEGMRYFSVWLGESKGSEFTATFKNFKCYDKEGNSLGVQVNKKNVQLSHVGESENYKQAEAVYYNKETQGLIILKEEKRAVKQLGGMKEECTYRIVDDDNLILVTKDGKENYDYAWLQMTDEDGKNYVRLKDTKVTFVNGKEKSVVKVTAENGFKVTEPEKPTDSGNIFQGWFLSDEEAFDFDSIVYESITLYAKWQDENGREYLAVNGETGTFGINKAMLISIVSGAGIILASGIVSVLIVRRKKNGGQ